jgi:asparagine synthase (glutamine-hydrolysing)
MRALFSGKFLGKLGEREGFQPLLGDIDVRGQLVGRDPLHQALYLWAKTVLPTYILTVLGDRMEMAHSIEGRVPFLDHHVVEVIRSQPVNHPHQSARRSGRHPK